MGSVGLTGCFCFRSAVYITVNIVRRISISTCKSLGIQSPCQRMIWVYNHLLNKVFRFHYHSQKVIGSLGHISTTFPDIGKTFIVMSSAMSSACRLRATQVGVFFVVVFRIGWYSPTQRIYGGWYIYLSIITQLQSLRIQLCPKISGFPL